MLRILNVVTALIVTTGCAGSTFTAGRPAAPVSGSAANAGSRPQTASAERTGSGESVSKLPQSSGQTSQSAPQTPAENISVTQLKQECLFAVSGTWIGYGDYKDTFPNLMEAGKPVAHGGRFDTVGGIYLAARETPYVHGEGEKELDDAVKWTFDSILAGPGMHAEIHDEKGTVLFTGEGPLVGESSHYAEDPQWTGKYLEKLLQRKASLPLWLQRLLNSGYKPVSIKNLHGARWVKVSAVTGGQCINAR
jgi:hypothetical protein